jgi:hypothetical protein
MGDDIESLRERARGKNRELSAPEVTLITATTVTLAAPLGANRRRALEYGIAAVSAPDTIAWQTEPLFAGLDPDTAYHFFARYTADTAKAPPPSLLAILTDPSGGTPGIILDANGMITTYEGERGIALVIPARINGRAVTGISGGVDVFYYRQLTSVIIPNSVTSIGGGAFYWNQQLTTVIIPNSVTTIGGYAFAWNSLNSVTFAGTIPSSGFSDYAFVGSGGGGIINNVREVFYANNPTSGTPGTYTITVNEWMYSGPPGP